MLSPLPSLLTLLCLRRKSSRSRISLNEENGAISNMALSSGWSKWAEAVRRAAEHRHNSELEALRAQMLAMSQSAAGGMLTA